MRKKNIFITGTPRSGTTWLAEMLSFAPNLNYISGEPFNLKVSEKLFGFKAPFWYYNINGTEDAAFYDKLKSALNEKLGIGDVYRRIILLLRIRCFEWRPYLRIFKLIYFNVCVSRVNLIKDPVAFFSTNYIAKYFNARVVFITRHPCAFIASMNRVNWEFDFTHLIENGAFDNLSKETFSKLYNKELIGLDRNILLWKIVHNDIRNHLEKNHDYMVVSHEELSLNPVDEFKKLYNQLDLEFTSKVEKQIISHTKSSNTVNAKENEVHTLKRNSKGNVESWKKKLSKEEQSYILEQTKELRLFFNYK